jgi:hypothetical protein
MASSTTLLTASVGVSAQAPETAKARLRVKKRAKTLITVSRIIYSFTNVMSRKLLI